MHGNTGVSRSFLERHLAQLLPEAETQVLSPDCDGSATDSGAGSAGKTLQQLLRAYASAQKMGSRERGALQEAAYLYARYRPFFCAGNTDNMVNTDSGELAQRVAECLFDVQQRAMLDSEEWLLRYSGYLPQWLYAALEQQCDAALQAAEALLQPAPVDWRVNLLRNRRDRVVQALHADGVAARVTPYSPWGVRLQSRQSLQQHSLYQSGAIELQDEGSQLLALLTGARRDELVVDFCAGAGGKTLALLAMMRAADGGRQHAGKVYALEVSAARLARLQPRLARSGAARHALYTQVLENEHDARLQKLHGKARRVLVDAPCSGTGTLRRQPEIKWRLLPGDVLKFQARQLSILQAAARLTAGSGRLVYATCSLLHAENEAVAEAFDSWCSEQGLDFEPLPVQQVLEESKVPAARQLCTADGSYLRLWPHRHGCDGFFAACWKRTG